jgi:hypothetical protein
MGTERSVPTDLSVPRDVGCWEVAVYPTRRQPKNGTIKGPASDSGGDTVAELALQFEGEYTTYQDFDQNRERWIPALKERGLTPWILGQMIFARHANGSFRTLAAAEEIAAGDSLRLRIEGITPYCPLAIVSGRLDGPPPEAFGEILFPFEDSLDVLARVPGDAEAGVYVFFGQQWEPDGQPAYPGGSLIYPSAIASVRVRPLVQDEAFWQSFEPWPEGDAEDVRENIRRLRAGE